MHRELALTRSGWRTVSEAPLVHLLGKPADEASLIKAVLSNDDAALARIGGNWAVIVEHDTHVTLVQDNLRSYPLYYTAPQPGETLYVCDDIALMRSFTQSVAAGEAQSTEFRHLGFVTGSSSLFPNIHLVQNGEIVCIDQETGTSRRFYRMLKYTGKNIRDDKTLDQQFSAAMDITFGRMFESIGDRQVLLPLSGGLDSRLIAIALKEYGHKNVQAFTYGVGETPEVGISREVANALGIEWRFIQYPEQQLKQEWQSPETADFIRAAYSGNALPHIQDWFAVKHLRKAPGIESDAVFLPGHCVVGAMHHEHIMAESEPVSRERIVGYALEHHASITPGSKQALKETDFAQNMLAYLDAVGYNGSPVSRLEALENINYLERQAKYINNSVRCYEHYGFGWALPLLDIEIFEAWEDLAPEIAQDREWYRRFVGRRYAKATGQTVGEFTANNVSTRNRNAVKTVLRGIGALTLAERVITWRAVQNHPMGFQYFLGPLRETALRTSIMRGGNQMGLFAELFLEDRWNKHTHLFTQPAAQQR